MRAHSRTESATLFAEAQRRHAAGDNAGAAAIYKTLLRNRPNDAQLLYVLGAAQAALGQLNEARTALSKALKMRPNDAAVHRDLAATYRREGRLPEAHRVLDHAIELLPDNPLLLSTKADCHFIAGEFERALATLRPALDCDVQHISLALVFARLAPRAGQEQRAVEMLDRCLMQDRLAPIVRADALFRLGDLLDRLGQYDRAFAVIQQANQLRGTRFDPKSFSRSVDDLIDLTWTKTRVRQLPRSTAKTDKPIFIVGMPRSGTSLVEQILASHPDVFGAGELNHIPKLVHERQATIGGAMSLATDLEWLTQESVDREARAYVGSIRRLSPKARRVTDKMPLNCLHLGLISLLFPAAKVIHCVRDPMDTCLSCFFQNFAGHNPFAYDLTHLGLFYRDYQRIMRHWREVLGIKILDVQYEDLVADQEGWSRRMLESIGLEWDDACLRFHESKRVVLTLSNDQVRRPMYSSSIGRWRNYEKHLGPLKQALQLSPSPSAGGSGQG
ncbi:MAG: sulfotransferase [Phycisphaerales bacterium]|nr:sulfotransferase [Phycisphaerales bacterium]